MHLILTGLTSAIVIAAALVVGATDARAVGSSDAPSHSVACVDTLEQPWS